MSLAGKAQLDRRCSSSSQPCSLTLQPVTARPCPGAGRQYNRLRPAQLSRPAPTLLVWLIRPVPLCRVRANKMLGLSLSSWPGIWSFQHSTSAASSLWIWSCIPQAPSMSPIATHQACCHPFLVPSAPEHQIPTLTWHHRFVQRIEGHWSEGKQHVLSEPVALRLAVWEGHN